MNGLNAYDRCYRNTRYIYWVFALVLALPWGVAAQSPPVVVLRVVGNELQHEFSDISGVRELPDGRVLVLDTRDRVLQLADFTKDLATQVGRHGSGPGEYRAPVGLFAAPGDSTIIFDGGQTRVLYADASARLGPSVSTAHLGASTSGMVTRFVPQNGDALGRLYALESPLRVLPEGLAIADSAAIHRWARTGSDLLPIAYIRFRSLSDRGGAIGGPSAIPFVVGDQWAVAGDGRVAIVRYDTYRVEYVETDGRRTVGPSISYVPVRVTNAIKDEWRRQKPANIPEPPRWPEHMPPFLSGAALFAPDGMLWILRTGPAGSAPTYDVIDRVGRPVRQIRLDGPGRIVGFGRDHVYASRIDDDGLHYLRRLGKPD